MRAKLEKRAEGYVAVIAMTAEELKMMVDNRGVSRLDLEQPWQDIDALTPEVPGNTSLCRIEVRVAE